jgi:hypothetical protein
MEIYYIHLHMILNFKFKNTQAQREREPYSLLSVEGEATRTETPL